MTRSFGRYEIADPRDGQYVFRAGASKRTSRVWDTSRWSGDQKATPHCVGYGWAHWLDSSPIRQWMHPDGIYSIAKYLDEWEGIDYDGTSVRAGAKVLAQLGAISEYRWARNSGVVANHILETGPVVIGVDWYSGMSAPDSSHVMRPKGALEGGHCGLLCGYNGKTKMFKFKNSWGPGWGKGGYAYISVPDLGSLLFNGGEACVGVESKLKP